MITLGYASLVILAATRGAGVLVAALRPVGRMTLTNYLGQTLIMTTLFYMPWGPRLFGRMDYMQLWGVVVAVWALQLAWSLRRTKIMVIAAHATSSHHPRSGFTRPPRFIRRHRFTVRFPCMRRRRFTMPLRPTSCGRRLCTSRFIRQRRIGDMTATIATIAMTGTTAIGAKRPDVL